MFRTRPATVEGASSTEEAADVSREVRAESEEVATATSQQTASLAKASEQITSLTSQADERQGLLAGFETDRTADATTAGAGELSAAADGGRPSSRN